MYFIFLSTHYMRHVSKTFCLHFETKTESNLYLTVLRRNYNTITIMAITVAENTFLVKRLIDRVKTIECYFCNRSAIMAKFSLSPLRVQADTRRFDFRTF